MKHKPSTKRQLHVSYHTALKKMNRLHWKTTFFFFSLNDGEGDTQNTLWNVSDAILHAPNPKRRRTNWKGDIRLAAAGSASRAQGCGELLQLLRTNIAVWVKPRCFGETTISSHHCQVLSPWQPHPHSNQCARTALKWQRIATSLTLHSFAYQGEVIMKNSTSFINLFCLHIAL